MTQVTAFWAVQVRPSFTMRRILSIVVTILVLAQALAASVPTLHEPTATKPGYGHGKHDCCPKPVVEVRDCCPKTIGCPHQNHSAGACCCAESGETGMPTSKIAGSTGAVVAGVTAVEMDGAVSGHFVTSSPSPPLDNSPPILVLRN